MRWTISFITENNIISVETEGQTTPESANQMVQEIVEASAAYGSTLVLVDHRKLKTSLSFMEMHQRAKAWQHFDSPREYRIADVVPEERLADFRYFETALRNRGYNTRVFTDIVSAEKWLTKKRHME